VVCAWCRTSSPARPPPADRTIVVGAPDLDALLADIEAHYGSATRRVVASTW
jgi:hypothetical protein